MAKPLTSPQRAEDERPLYDRDFYRWTQEQAALLRGADALKPHGEAPRGVWQDLDWENLAEEIETLGRSERNEIESRLMVLLLHLLKWAYQRDHRSRSWEATIVEQRRRIAKRVLDNPSLRSYPQLIFAEEYSTARLKAAGETDLPLETFPERCPFSVDQALDEAFGPGE